MASTKSTSGSAQDKTKSSSAPRGKPTIPNYDAQTVDEVTRRLRKLSQADLAKLESYERKGQGRATVLARIAALRGEAPWSGYDDMEAEEVNDALKKRDGDSARAVLDYERQHKARTTIIEFAERQRDAAAGSAPTTSRRNGAGKTERSSGSKSSTRKRTSASSRQRSSSGRSPKAAQSRTRASKASRPTAPSAASSRRGKGTQASSRSKSRTSGASRSPSSSGARTEKAAKGAGRAVAAAAKNSRDVVGTAAQDTGHAVGTAAKKSKGPALTAGAVAVALGGGMVLGAKLLPKRTILGIPIPRRRSRLSQAAKSLGKARNGILETGNRVDAIGKQVSAVNDGLQRIASGPTKG